MSSFWLDLCQLKCFTLTTMRLGCTLMPFIPYNLIAGSKFRTKTLLSWTLKCWTVILRAAHGCRMGRPRPLLLLRLSCQKNVRQNSLLWTPNRFGISFSSFCRFDPFLHFSTEGFRFPPYSLPRFSFTSPSSLRMQGRPWAVFGFGCPSWGKIHRDLCSP